MGLNVNSDGSKLIKEAPEAYGTVLPIDRCSEQLIKAGIPAKVSYHAGTYLCNAIYFLTSTTPILLECEQEHIHTSSLTLPKRQKLRSHNKSTMVRQLLIVMQHLTSNQQII